MDARLLDACMSGNVQALQELIRQDPPILHRAVTCCEETPLHVAVLCGHLGLVRALLRRQWGLASERDASGCVPLHLASAEGNLEVVRELLGVDSELCCARDSRARTPLHLAVMKGRLEVMREFIRVCPRSASERHDRGETVFHLAVRYGRFEALKLLVELLRDDHPQLLGAADDEDNTVLHFAASFKQTETVRYLVSLEEVKAITNDHTEKSPRDLNSFEIEMAEIPGVRRGGDQPSNPAIARQSRALTTAHFARTRTGLIVSEIKRLYHRAEDYLY